MELEQLSKETLGTILEALSETKKHDEIWCIVDSASSEQEIINNLKDLIYHEKADLVLDYVRESKIEPWVTIQIMDKDHLEQTYQLIKDNPNITQTELVKELKLKII